MADEPDQIELRQPAPVRYYRPIFLSALAEMLILCGNMGSSEANRELFHLSDRAQTHGYCNDEE